MSGSAYRMDVGLHVGTLDVRAPAGSSARCEAPGAPVHGVATVAGRGLLLYQFGGGRVEVVDMGGQAAHQVGCHA
jgi:hypothetical protein